MRFVIYIRPAPKERPRFNPYTKRTYTPKSTADFENELKRQVCVQLGKYFDYPLYDNTSIPLCVDMDFVFSRPKTKMAKRYLDGLMWYPVHPDKDNLEKAVLDSLNGILWKDDRQVVDGRVRKFYAEKNGKERICLVVRRAGDPPVTTCDFPNADLLDEQAGRKPPSD